MGKIKEALMELEDQLNAADAADDQVSSNLLIVIVAMNGIASRLRTARDQHTFPNQAIRDAIDHTLTGVENDIKFLEKLVKILSDEDDSRMAA